MPASGVEVMLWALIVARPQWGAVDRRVGNSTSAPATARNGRASHLSITSARDGAGAGQTLFSGSNATGRSATRIGWGEVAHGGCGGRYAREKFRASTGSLQWVLRQSPPSGC